MLKMSQCHLNFSDVLLALLHMYARAKRFFLKAQTTSQHCCICAIEMPFLALYLN